MRPCRSSPSLLSSRRAFTLVEMMVAISLLLLMSMFLTYISEQGSRLWLASERGNQYRVRARAILDFMGNDVRLAALPLSQENVAAASSDATPSLEFVINPPTVSDAAHLNRDTLFFQAPVATDRSRGDLAVVGYFVQWTGATPSLCRLLVNPSDTAHYKMYATTAPAGWVSDALLDELVKPENTDHYQGLFLNNVIGLWIAAYDAAGKPLNANAAFDSRNPPKGSDQIAHPLPATVEIAIVTLDDAGVRRLTPAMVTAIRQHYRAFNSLTGPDLAARQAAAFVKALPAACASSAAAASIKVSLNNYR